VFQYTDPVRSEIFRSRSTAWRRCSLSRWKWSDDAALCARDLHCLDRAEDLPERSGHAARRDLARRARLLQTPGHDLRHSDDREERQEDKDRDRRVHTDEDPQGGGGEDRVAEQVHSPVASVFGVLHVVAEHAHRLTGRPVERARTGPSQDLRQHVPLQHRAHAEAEEHVDRVPRRFRGRRRDAGPDERGREPGDGGWVGGPALQCVEGLLRDETRQQPRAVHGGPEEVVADVDPPPERRHAPEEASGAERL
jgi:hypothetical protein